MNDDVESNFGDEEDSEFDEDAQRLPDDIETTGAGLPGEPLSDGLRQRVIEPKN